MDPSTALVAFHVIGFALLLVMVGFCLWICAVLIEAVFIPEDYYQCSSSNSPSTVHQPKK